ncbi:MAG: alpha/beta fold hydrolase [Anaerolineae bacterium]
MAAAAAAALLVTAALAACAPARPSEETPSQMVEMVVETSEAAREETAVPVPGPSIPAGDRPGFQEADCQFEVPGGYDVTCGYLLVPENRRRPESRLIALHVAIFHASTPTPAPDPVIHLVGGPGGSLLDSAAFYLRRGGDAILRERDYILFNQRGTRYAVPDLSCTEVFYANWSLTELNLTEDETNQRTRDILMTCHDAWVAEGIDLAAYNSAENAADVVDLWQALGYEQVNLYGISYGSRLALTIMRDHPEGVRSVILDSVYPPQVDLYSTIGFNAQRAFNELFEYCASDEQCNTSYPELERKFYEVVEALNASPPVVSVPGPDRAYMVVMNGSRFLEAVFAAMYSDELIPDLPGVIQAVWEGEYGVMRPYLRSARGSMSLSLGMYHSVQCSEELPFEDYDRMLERLAGLHPLLRDEYADRFYFDVCEQWAAGEPDPVENRPVSSDIPTLLMAGRFDPITPPAWAQLAARTLSHHYYFEFPTIGHGVIRSDGCALSIALDFLADPLEEPDASCLLELQAAG